MVKAWRLDSSQLDNYIRNKKIKTDCILMFPVLYLTQMEAANEDEGGTHERRYSARL